MKKVNILTKIIILLVISLSITGFFTYKWFTNDTSCLKCETANDNKETVKSNYDVSVVDAVNVIPVWFANDPDTNVKIIILKIIGDGKNIETLNKTILDEILDRAYVPVDDGSYCEVSEPYENVNVSYKSIIKNDVVFILVKVEISPWYASGGGLIKEGVPVKEDFYNYFYDIKNDKILKATEALEKNGYSDERYLKEITTCFTFDEEVKCTLEEAKKVINNEGYYHGCSYIDIENNDIKLHYDSICN